MATEPGKLELIFTTKGGKETRMEVFTFKDKGGVGLAMYNTDEVSRARFSGKNYIGLFSKCFLIKVTPICM